MAKRTASFDNKFDSVSKKIKSDIVLAYRTVLDDAQDLMDAVNDKLMEIDENDDEIDLILDATLDDLNEAIRNYDEANRIFSDYIESNDATQQHFDDFDEYIEKMNDIINEAMNTLDKY